MSHTVTEADEHEAHCRYLMAERARLPLVWQTRARRVQLAREIDAELDRWLACRG